MLSSGEDGRAVEISVQRLFEDSTKDQEAQALAFREYMRRQEQHRVAETAALLDTARFADRAQELYGYDHFICDSGGSICEVVNPEDRSDPILTALSDAALMVWIKGSDAHTGELIRRFDRAPKPMYYQPEFLHSVWAEYLETNSLTEGKVDPDAFVRWAYARALAHRQPLYEAMARNWGVTVTAEDVATITTQDDFENLIAQALEARG